MKLFDARGEDALDLIADLIDPIADIAADEEILKCIQTNQKLKAVKFSIKKHKKAILEILAICEGVPVDEYKPKAIELPKKLLEVINHPDVAELFTSQAQTEVSSSGSATENTEVEES